MAHAAYPAGNVYLRIRDKLGPLFDNDGFTTVYASVGQRALHPWQLAQESVLRFAENLSDRQAVDAVRAHIDWKHALGLDLTDEGFHYSVLSEFRTRLVNGGIVHSGDTHGVDLIGPVHTDPSWQSSGLMVRPPPRHVPHSLPLSPPSS